MAEAFVVEMLAPGSLTSHPQNWRTHPEAQRTALAESIAEHGWLAAPIWNKRTGHLLDGHARVEQAQAASEAFIPVRVIDVSDRQEKRILASFDRIGELRERDDRAITALLQELGASGPLPAGWNDQDLEGLLASLPPELGLLPGVDPDALPEAVETRCQPGDLWLLGNHRLLCGDSTKPEAVRRLFGNEEPALLFTSPPYLHQRDYGAPIGDWNDLMCGVFLHVRGAPQILVNLGLVYQDGEWLPYWDQWIEWMRQSGWRRFGFYVWDQGPGLPGDWNGRLAPSHEFVFHFNRMAIKPRKTKAAKHAGEMPHGAGLRDAKGVVAAWSQREQPIQERKIPDSVFRVCRHKGRGSECQVPAVMAQGLALEAIEAFSRAGDGVYEPFAGSGTTLIACEQLGRAARCLEIESRYCDVILARYEQATGQAAMREV